MTNFVDHYENFSIKESSGDPNRVHLLARDYPHIQLSCGMDDQALEFFAWGARSWVCAGSNFAPEIHAAQTLARIKQRRRTATRTSRPGYEYNFRPNPSR